MNIIVELENSHNGLPTGTILFSKNSERQWFVENRIIESIASEEIKRFPFEREKIIHLNIIPTSNRNKVISSLIEKNKNNIFQYQIRPINHEEKPELNEILSVHFNIQSRYIVYKILDIQEDKVIVADPFGDKIESSKILLRSFAQIGDLIRHCEHCYYDVIDENGDFVYR